MPPPPARPREFAYLFVTHLDPQPKSDAPFARFQGGVAKPFLELYERKASPDGLLQYAGRTLGLWLRPWPHGHAPGRVGCGPCSAYNSIF